MKIAAAALAISVAIPAVCIGASGCVGATCAEQNNPRGCSPVVEASVADVVEAVEAGRDGEPPRDAGRDATDSGSPF